MSALETINVLYRISEYEPFSFTDTYDHLYAADNDENIIYNGLKIDVPTGKEVWLVDILLAFQEHGLGCCYNCWASVGEDLFIHLPSVCSVVPIFNDRHATLIVVPTSSPPYIPVSQGKLFNQLSKRAIYSRNHYDQSINDNKSNNHSITGALKGLKVPKLSFKRFEKLYINKNDISNTNTSIHNDNKNTNNMPNKFSKPEDKRFDKSINRAPMKKDSGNVNKSKDNETPYRANDNDNQHHRINKDRDNNRDPYKDSNRDTYRDHNRDAYRDSNRDNYNNKGYNRDNNQGTQSMYKSDDMAAIADTAVSAAKSLFSFAKTMVDVTAQVANVASANLGISTGNIVIGQTLPVGQTRVTVVRLLAEGGFGSVFLANDVSSSSTSYALKQVLCQSREQIQDAQAELRALRECSSHPNIISLIDHAQFNTASAPRSDSNSQVLYLFPLYCRGTAWDSIEKSQEGRPWPYTEFRALNMIMGVAKGLHFMHQKNMAHSDVKPHNILINNEDKPVIMDLGSTTTAKRQVNTRKDALNIEDLAASKTSAAYRSPELTSTPHPCTLDGRVDIWGLGATMYCLAYGTSPFESPTEGIKKLAILNGRYSYPPGRRMRDCTFSESFTDLIDSMLQTDIEKRPFADDVEKICQALLRDLSR